MRRFTVILFATSLFLIFVASNRAFSYVYICEPSSTGRIWKSCLKGIKLALNEEQISFSIEKTCSYIPSGSFIIAHPYAKIEAEGSIILSPLKSPYYPSIYPDETYEASRIAEISGKKVAIFYDEKFAYFKEKIKEKVIAKGKSVIFEFGFKSSKIDFNSLFDTVKANRFAGFDTAIIISKYIDALMIAPYLEIVHPKPAIVGTHLFSCDLMFFERSFIKRANYFEWYVPWIPMMHVKEFIYKFNKAYRENPDRYAALGYDLATILAKAIKEHKPLYRIRITGVTTLKGLTKELRPIRKLFLIKLKDLPPFKPF